MQRRGYTAIDGDEHPNLVRLEDKLTSQPTEWPRGYVDWSKYSWNLQEPVLKETLASAENVFLVGIFGNQPDYYDLFDALIVLTITPEEYKHRLEHRPRRQVGDDEQNMADRILKYPILLQRFLDSRALPVDASGTVTETVANVLTLTGLITE